MDDDADADADAAADDDDADDDDADDDGGRLDGRTHGRTTNDDDCISECMQKLYRIQKHNTYTEYMYLVQEYIFIWGRPGSKARFALHMCAKSLSNLF